MFQPDPDPGTTTDAAVCYARVVQDGRRLTIEVGCTEAVAKELFNKDARVRAWDLLMTYRETIVAASLALALFILLAGAAGWFPPTVEAAVVITVLTGGCAVAALLAYVSPVALARRVDKLLRARVAAYDAAARLFDRRT